jgi:hypothetical protein
MRLGLDFDNTIVRYDGLFHRVALEAGLIPPDLPISKVSVRDHLRRNGKEDAWIEMQGYVYGARMSEADMYPGVSEFLSWARSHRLPTSIVSHKTRYPFSGPKYDLHRASREWVDARLRDEAGPLVEPTSVFFELTKREKVARIAGLGCAVFIDDLPEIFEEPGFPKQAVPILFDPDSHHSDSNVQRLGSWGELRGIVEQRWHPNS